MHRILSGRIACTQAQANASAFNIQLLQAVSFHQPDERLYLLQTDARSLRIGHKNSRKPKNKSAKRKAGEHPLPPTAYRSPKAVYHTPFESVNQTLIQSTFCTPKEEMGRQPWKMA